MSRDNNIYNNTQFIPPPEGGGFLGKSYKNEAFNHQFRGVIFTLCHKIKQDIEYSKKFNL